MSIPLLLLTNGRPECITKTIASLTEHLTGADGLVIVDDSDDDVYGQWLYDEFAGGPFNAKVLTIKGDHGYWRAMRTVWSLARHWDVDAFAFWEDDFVLNTDIDLNELAALLDTQPHLTQVALRRQPWWPNEAEHGGLIEALEAQGQEFTERTDGDIYWIEHRACFTGNPSVIPRRTFGVDWPMGDWSESRFGKILFGDPQARGAYWGRRSDPPQVEHIGHQRVGSGY